VLPFLRHKTSLHGIVLLVGDTALLAGALFVATGAVLDVDPTVFLLYDGGAARLLPVLATMLVTIYLLDLYSKFQVRSRILLLQQLSLVAGVGFLAEALVVYVYREARLPAGVLLWGVGAGTACLFPWRLAYSRFLLQVVGGETLLFVGINPVVREIVARIAAAPELGLRVAGYVTDEWPPDPPPLGRHLGPVGALKPVVATEKPQRIVVGMPERRNRVPVGDLLQLRLSGVAIEEAASAYERVCQRICLRELRPSQLIFSGDLGPHTHRSLAQAATDYSIALAALLLASPLLLLAALAVKLAFPGPVLERQVRVGRGGATFDRLQFRVAPGRAGRLLVRLHCHRLPRLLNILRGEMSIVGPHPEPPEVAEAHALQVPYYRHRLCVLPGLTGWAQVNHRSTGQLEDTVISLEYDLYYIKNHSWRMDAFLILDAVKSALLRRSE